VIIAVLFECSDPPFLSAYNHVVGVRTRSQLKKYHTKSYHIRWS
jgi:hypothetical protein